MAQASTGKTGTTDVTYNLVSVLYHALQGAEAYDQYISDAEQKNDKDLAQFFRDTATWRFGPVSGLVSGP